MAAWWEKRGREEFADLCEVRNPHEADYIVVWVEDVEAIDYTYTVRRTEMSDVWLDTHTYDRSTGQTTNSNTYGTITTTRPETKKRTRKEWHILMQVRAVERGEGNFRASKILYETKHVGRSIWSKPDKDCLVDAMNFLHVRSQ